MAEQDELLKELSTILNKEKNQRDLDRRSEKLKQVLTLLAGGTALASCLVMPGLSRMFRGIDKDNSEWKEWKMFNKSYLRNTIRKLERQKLVEIEDMGTYGRVKLTQNGRAKILEMGLESITISKPAKWDGKWRFVFYDVVNGKRGVRDRLRDYLKAAGFFQFQESVYLHAYPCEQEVEFLRHYLGISGEVRLVTADHIENDRQFLDYFGLS